MSALGGSDDLLVLSRSALLDALEALSDQTTAVIVIGAQAIYLHAGNAPVALAAATKDSDLVVDPRVLSPEPLLEQAMKRAGFFRNPFNGQPGAWMNPGGIPVDLMVPEALAGSGGKSSRGGRIPPHAKSSTRRARGLEAAIIDNSEMEIRALDEADNRRYSALVAGPTALLIAKLHKIAERVENPNRLNDKDAHDIYRLLVATETSVITASLGALLDNSISQMATVEALGYLRTLFAESPEVLGSLMAGRAEEGIGDPANVSLSVSLLAADVIAGLPTEPAYDSE
ncbi:hypothetical protein IRJ34_17350 [Paenarthrobacter sp. GOM3]|uniref:hypothetical protein n=1 Tax=Paenarthrobacter sp. GOM3 TaxID=2782567 RepID=UPI001BADE510|nr:hypothetical protein [Paenarthrobacter sp. GOM3]WOH18099.1 hypothetical protein IRJ34_17350 [Paenarthrobacter sp. GOM3]